MTYPVGQIVRSTSGADLGVVCAPEDEDPPDDAVAFVIWWPRTTRESRGWVTEDEITTEPSPVATRAVTWSELREDRF